MIRLLLSECVELLLQKLQEIVTNPLTKITILPTGQNQIANHPCQLMRIHSL